MRIKLRFVTKQGNEGKKMLFNENDAGEVDMVGENNHVMDT